MRKILMLFVVVGLILGLSSIGNASIEINACGYDAAECDNGRSGPDYTIGALMSVTPGLLYDISVVDGAWGSFEVTDFTSPNTVHNFSGQQGWLWSLAIYNGVETVMLGDHSVAGGFIYPGPHSSASSAQAAALLHNSGDKISVSSPTGELWFYVYDPSNRDNAGSLTFDVSVVPEPVSTTLFIIGGVVLGGRSFLRRKRNK